MTSDHQSRHRLPRSSKRELNYRADLYRRLAAAVSDGDMSERLATLAARYQDEANSHPGD
jgi:hypothetical protein